MSSVLSSLESLNGLIAFAAAVQAGSFSAAGRQLGLSASAVGKAVERLELRLSTRLLNRTTRSLALTSEGEVLYHYADKVLKDLHEAERELSMRQHNPRGRLRVSAAPTLARRALLPLLHDFHARYPEVIVNISLDAAHLDIVEEGFDLALWTGELEDSSLQARLLGSYALITCAAPTYFAEHGIPASPDELADHHCLHYRHPDNERLEPWRYKDKLIHKPACANKALNDAEALVSAALAGLGIVQVPDYMVRNELADGRLLEILKEHATATRDVFLVWPPQSAQIPRVRVFIDFLVAQLGPQLSQGTPS
ncbi:LysR family transcriptional regulator [Stenotrophomonas terrae]|uniref:LysR family transcriptional regulator n=2 Tax=Stenotrophomonas terrae TaxID=405446 RepID=A0A0R0CIJ6_9GAMM|nr:LysR family transcriptional regulator [Stenotrophomonas terrae]